MWLKSGQSLPHTGATADWKFMAQVTTIIADRKNARDLFITKEKLLKILLYGIAVFVRISPLAVYWPVDNRYAVPITGSLRPTLKRLRFFVTNS